MKRLTAINHPNIEPKVLTEHTSTHFTLGLRYPLDNGYTFSEISINNNKQFQKFLNKVSKMTVQQVEDSFTLPSDKNDNYNSLCVRHYKITDKFRIHTIYEDGVHIIIRIDPNHHFHP